MKRNHLIFVFLIGISILLFGCKQKQGDHHRENQTTVKLDVDKEKVNNFWKHYRMATNLRIAGEYEKAKKSYQEALNYNEDHEDALYYLGNMHLEMQELKEAETNFKRLIEVNPSNTRAYSQLGNLYLDYRKKESFNLNKANRQFQIAHNKNKEETGPLIYLGFIKVLEGHLDSAKVHLSHVIGSNYRSAEALYLLGFIAWERGNTKLALSNFSDAYTYTLPDESMKAGLSEGDTKTGKTYGKEGNQSFLESIVEDLSTSDGENLKNEMKNSYSKFNKLISEIADF